MVTVSRKEYMNSWSYEITASVPHQWASEQFDKICGHGYSGLGTYHDDVVHISLHDRDPKFKEHLAWIITSCVEKEDDSVNKINARILKLQEEREIILSKIKGKYR